MAFSCSLEMTNGVGDAAGPWNLSGMYVVTVSSTSEVRDTRIGRSKCELEGALDRLNGSLDEEIETVEEGFFDKKWEISIRNTDSAFAPAFLDTNDRCNGRKLGHERCDEMAVSMLCEEEKTLKAE